MKNEGPPILDEIIEEMYREALKEKEVGPRKGRPLKVISHAKEGSGSYEEYSARP